MKRKFTFSKPFRSFPLSWWDGMALLLIIGLLAILALGAKQMSQPFTIGQSLPISLDPKYLPEYSLQTVLRMLIAMLASLLFTFTVGTLAAKNKHAERFIIPLIDILQSVPVLGFLSITIAGFIALFPGSLWGPEFACIFVIFTAQAWNMTLGFYQSLRNIPFDLQETAAMFQLSNWQRFWKIEVPLAMPSLLWNMMMSMSAGWVFLVSSEAISVANQDIKLPGIGSYIAVALTQENLHAIFYAIIATFFVILLYDQLLFRPLLQWSEKFRFEQTGNDKTTRSWFVYLLQRTRLVIHVDHITERFKDFFINRLTNKPRPIKLPSTNAYWLYRILIIIWYGTVLILITIITYWLINYIFSSLSLGEAWHAIKLGFATLLRVLATIVISSLIWLPLGVWIGLRPHVAKWIQPVIQFLAAFPAKVLFPLVVILIIQFQLNVEIWVTALMLLGSQWYILFNVVAGASMIPKEYRYAASNFQVSGWLWWKRLVLPAIFPYYITGAITAAGAAWNLSIVAEIVSWGQHTLVAYGLGAYVEEYTTSGDFPRIALGISIMCVFVLLFNRLVWQPLYKLAISRYGSY